MPGAKQQPEISKLDLEKVFYRFKNELRLTVQKIVPPMEKLFKSLDAAIFKFAMDNQQSKRSHQALMHKMDILQASIEKLNGKITDRNVISERLEKAESDIYKMKLELHFLKHLKP